jgi:hypothetical protein
MVEIGIAVELYMALDISSANMAEYILFMCWYEW